MGPHRNVGMGRTYSAQFSSQAVDHLAASTNSNIGWTYHYSSALFYFVMITLFHVFVSTNLDVYFNSTSSSSASNESTPGQSTAFSSFSSFSSLGFRPPLTFWSATFGLGSTYGNPNNTPRFWLHDSYNITALFHATLTWTLMHWVKGSANFYDSGEMSSLTWYEQLAIGNSDNRSYYSPRLLITVPTVLCLLACCSASYTPPAVMANCAVLGVLILSKMRFMHGVRLFGINRTVGVDDGASSVCSVGSTNYEGARFKRE